MKIRSQLPLLLLLRLCVVQVSLLSWISSAFQGSSTSLHRRQCVVGAAFQPPSRLVDAEETNTPGSSDFGDDSGRENPPTHFIFPGGGIYFYWQAGVVEYLRSNGYDLTSRNTFAGASAGALTATLTATGVDFYKATEMALEMAKDSGVWDRKTGLQGIWGPMIYEWLDELIPQELPSDLLNGGAGAENDQEDSIIRVPKLTLLVTPVPSFGKTAVQTYADRQDLIRANMASVHLPWFLDSQLTSPFRGKPHIDGSFLSKAKDYLPPRSAKSRVLRLDYTKDPEMQSRGSLGFVEALSPDGIYGLLDKGKAYAKYLEERGRFRHLDRLD